MLERRAGPSAASSRRCPWAPPPATAAPLAICLGSLGQSRRGSATGPGRGPARRRRRLLHLGLDDRGGVPATGSTNSSPRTARDLNRGWGFGTTVEVTEIVLDKNTRAMRQRKIADVDGPSWFTGGRRKSLTFHVDEADAVVEAAARALQPKTAPPTQEPSTESEIVEIETHDTVLQDDGTGRDEEEGSSCTHRHRRHGRDPRRGRATRSTADGVGSAEVRPASRLEHVLQRERAQGHHRRHGVGLLGKSATVNTRRTLWPPRIRPALRRRRREPFRPGDGDDGACRSRRGSRAPRARREAPARAPSEPRRRSCRRGRRPREAGAPPRAPRPRSAHLPARRAASGGGGDGRLVAFAGPSMTGSPPLREAPRARSATPSPRRPASSPRAKPPRASANPAIPGGAGVDRCRLLAPTDCRGRVFAYHPGVLAHIQGGAQTADVLSPMGASSPTAPNPGMSLVDQNAGRARPDPRCRSIARRPRRHVRSRGGSLRIRVTLEGCVKSCRETPGCEWYHAWRLASSPEDGRSTSADCARGGEGAWAGPKDGADVVSVAGPPGASPA